MKDLTKDLILLIRGITRPLLTLLLVIAAILLAFRGNAEATTTVLALASAAGGLWFGQHVLAKDG